MDTQPITVRLAQLRSDHDEVVDVGLTESERLDDVTAHIILASKAVYAAMEAGVQSQIRLCEDCLQTAALNWEQEIIYELFAAQRAAHRMEDTNSVEDSNLAATGYERLLMILPENFVTLRLSTLSNLCGAYHTVFEYTGKMGDLETSISFGQQALELARNNRHSPLSPLLNLGIALEARYTMAGQLHDLNQAVAAREEASSLAQTEYTERAVCLDGLGNVLRTRFGVTTNYNDLDQAALLQEEAVSLARTDDSLEASYLNNLGTTLLLRFVHRHSSSDLARCISVMEEAVALTPANHVDRSLYITNLANALESQPGPYEKPKYSGTVTSINRKAFAREARLITPDMIEPHPMHANDLEAALRALYVQTEIKTNFDRAISLRAEALLRIPHSHISRVDCLNSLVASLRRRWEQSRSMIDFQLAAAVMEETLCRTGPKHFNRPTFLFNAGCMYHEGFEAHCELLSLYKAIAFFREAVAIVPQGHPNHASILMQLGHALMSLDMMSLQQSDLDAAQKAFQDAVVASGSLVSRFRAANAWAYSLEGFPDQSMALNAYSNAMDLLPQVASLGSSVLDRYERTSLIREVARSAAGCATFNERFDLAIPWLEMGRSVVWGQFSELRTPLTDLRLANSNLADKLIQISDKVEKAFSSAQARNPWPTLGNPTAHITLETEVQLHRHLAEERNNVIAECRGLPGFEDFLKPETLSKLCAASREGIVVVCDIMGFTGNALILQGGSKEVTHVALEGLTEGKTAEFRDHINLILQSYGARERGSRRLDLKAKPDFRYILGDLWQYIVKPVFQKLGLVYCVSAP